MNNRTVKCLFAQDRLNPIAGFGTRGFLIQDDDGFGIVNATGGGVRPSKSDRPKRCKEAHKKINHDPTLEREFKRQRTS